MAKLYVIGGKLPLFTQEASFMESIYLPREWIVRPFSRRNPSNAGFLSPSLLIVRTDHDFEFHS